MEEKQRLGKAFPESSKKYERQIHTLPIGITNIERVLASGYYEDKTAYAGQMLIQGTPLLLIRPRRFGKSLFIDTLATIAEGEAKKELFKDCFIYKGIFKNEHGVAQTYDWKQYPVIRLDFSKLSNETPEVLSIDLKKLLYAIATNYGLHAKLKDPDGSDSLKAYFECLFKQLQSLGNGYEPKVVILIDEYDAPLVKLQWDDAEDSLYVQNQAVLKNFLEEVKACSKDCQLIFVTGVTKFSLSGLCSGANALDDVSMDEAFADVVGYKEENISTIFKDRLDYVADKLAQRTGKSHTKEEILIKLKGYYNGYRFTYNGPSVYNPSSLLSFFKEGSLEGYWYRKGDPSVLLNQMKQDLARFNLDWESCRFDATKDALLITKNNRKLDLIPLMYQTGYLTIDRYDPAEKTYLLKFPNAEVRESLAENLEEIANDQGREAGKRYSHVLKEALDQEDWIRFLTIVKKVCFASSSYEFIQKREKSFQGLLHSFLQGAFFSYGTHIRVRSEEHTGLGRMDLVIDDRSGDNPVTYILELKMNGCAREALAQIEDIGYLDTYYSSQKIVCMGMNFVFDETKDRAKRNPNHRNIDSCTLRIYTREDVDRDLEAGDIQQFVVQAGRFVRGAEG
jgi:hypothetical protein